MDDKKSKEPLTGSQKKYFKYIDGFISEYGHSPTREDIAEEFGTGINNVSRYIDVLCEKGWLRKDSSKRPPVLEVL